MRKILLTIMVVTLPCSVFLGRTISQAVDASTQIIPAITLVSDNNRCEEDESCWNCETMGNHICGLTPSENYAELHGNELPETL